MAERCIGHLAMDAFFFSVALLFVPVIWAKSGVRTHSEVDHGRGITIQAGRVASGDGVLLAECGLELCQRPSCGLGAIVPVLANSVGLLQPGISTVTILALNVLAA